MDSYEVRLRRQALADISEIRRWYQRIDPVLEDRFVAALNEGLDRLLVFPFAYQAIYRNTRRVSLKRFPYGVFYVVQDRRIIVVAVIHHRRDPAVAESVAE